MSVSIGISHGGECDTTSCPCKFVTTSMTVWTAAEQGSLDVVKSKSAKGNSIINKMDNYGYTPLHYAAQHNHIEIVKFLLDSGAQPDLHCCGATPLHRAAYSGSLKSCELLINAGADVNVQDYSFGDLNTPIQKAILNGHTAIIDVLLTHKDIDLNLENAAGLTATAMLNDCKDITHSDGQQTCNDDFSKRPNECIDTTDNIGDKTPLQILREESSLTSSDIRDYTVTPSVAISDTNEDVRCSQCKQVSLSYARNYYGKLVCLDCKYKQSNNLFVAVAATTITM